MNQHFYLHFETKPSFAELDKLFDQCESFQPIMSNSYTVIFDTDGKRSSFFDLARLCFPRHRYVAIQYSPQNYRQYQEAYYVSHGQ